VQNKKYSIYIIYSLAYSFGYYELQCPTNLNLEMRKRVEA
jgi:hypothetical protein